MQGINGMARLPIFICVVTYGTMIYVCLFHGSNDKIDVKDSSVRALEHEFTNYSNSVAGLQRENTHILRHLTNLSRENRELLHHIENSAVPSDKVLDKLDNLKVNVSLSLADLPDVVSSFKNLWEKLRIPAPVSPRRHPTSLLTVFTTWANDPSKYPIHNFTAQNWAFFKPVINPVVFTDDKTILKEIKRFGWEGLHIPKTAENGMPILKYMFMEATKQYDSVFYAYSNADILFTGSLVQTLTSLQYSDAFRISKHVLISGTRTNVLVNTSNTEDFSKQSVLQKAYSERGQLFMTSAEDYFITNKDYPWSEMPEVIVGSLAYDNWLVADARKRFYTAIDATKTLQATHLSESDNHLQSHGKEIADYNKVLLDRLFGDQLKFYFKGFVDCMELFTDKQDDKIVVYKRKLFANHC